MESFEQVLKDTRMAINKILILDAALNSILIFLIIYWLLAFLHIPGVDPYWALLPGGILFWVVLIRKFRTSKIREIEKKYPSLNEALRTASDNVNKNNAVVKELQKDILTQLRIVEVAAFAEPKTIYVQTVLIGLLCFAIVFSAPLSVTFGNAASEFLDKIPKTLNVGTATKTPDTNYEARPFVSKLVTTVNDALFGKPSVAELGDKELEVTLTAQGTELDVRKIQDVQDRDFTDTLPDEIYAKASETFEEDIKEEEQELVKNYFQKLAVKK
jgi:hypothetical protein